MIDITELLVKNRTKLIAQIYKPWIKTGGTALDVGCGNGIVTEGIAQSLAITITGCDIEKYLLRDIPYVHMNKANKLPFKKSTFETVMFNDVLHHASKENQIALITEAIRIAKKNVIIFELVPTALAYIFDYTVNKLYHPSMPIPLTFRTIAEWQTLFHAFPVHAETKHVPQPFFSPFSHVAFRLGVTP